MVFAVNPTRSARDLLQSLAFTFVYANLTSILAGVILGWLMEKAVVRGVSPWKIAIPGIVVFTAGGCLAAQSLLAAAGFSGSQHFWLDYFHALRFALPLALVFGLGAMTHATLLVRVQTMERELHEKQIAEERSRKLAAEARLRSLESWIHPHFLFNTLNSISALIALDPVRAEQTVGRLATLLRASLDTSANSLIPLHQEIAMVESFLDIERLRLGDNLRARVEVPVELRETMVPPMSVQSLVENAVKHGITPESEGGTLVVTARTDTGGVCIEVGDTGPGFDLADICEGHGLDKLVQRLDALFGDRARLNVFRRDNYSVVEMVLPRK
jgi:sensor histidine kinase YesM